MIKESKSLNNLFMAKSRPPKNVIEHTREVLEFLTSLKNLYPNAFEDKVWKAIEVSINYHDYGKINSRFQNIIYEDMNLDIKLLDILNSEYKKAGVIQIPHGILSMFFIDYETVCQELGENIAKAVLMAVCYHHDRDMEISRRLLSKVVNEDLKQYLTEFASYLGLENISLYRSNIDEVDIEELTEEEWKYFALIKGILNRADYAASGCMDRIEQTPYYNEQCISDKVLEKFKANSWSLRPVQKYMIDKVSSNLIVVASTGIGKTEGALLWTKDTKCFYTLPLRVSINAIYERIRGDYDYGYSELLHSDSLTYYIKEYDNKENKSVEPYLRYQQARIFASPLTICTVDQLFKFVFKANGFEPMLATLAYSTVIIDELQMYSPEVVACILYGLKQITDIGGKYAIITATFPKVLFDFMTKLRIPYEMPQKPFSNQIGPRHFIELNEGEMDYNLILSLGKKKKVLVISSCS
jgi:CRISPR-associated endonuclease/helicase Cas3